MTIDLHIIVSLIQLMVIGIGGLYFVWTMKSRLDLLIQETGIKHQANISKFNEIDKKLTDLSTSTVELVKQQLRMDHIDERLQELSNRLSRNGHGPSPKGGSKGST